MIVARRVSLLAACAALWSILSVPAFAATKVDIALVPATEFLPAMVAKEKGFFSQHGIDASITPTFFAQNGIAGVVSGNLQVTFMTVPVLMGARENGLDLVAISGLGHEERSNPQLSLMSMADTPYKTAKSLEGGIIGVPGINSFIDIVTRNWLARHGADLSKIRFVELGAPQLPDALRNSTINAATLVNPFRSMLLKSGKAQLLGDVLAEFKDGQPTAFWATTRQWADTHADVVEGFVAALNEANAFIAAQPAEAMAILTRFSKMPPDSPPANWSTALTPEDLRYLADLSLEFHLTTKPSDLEAAVWKKPRP
jgi:NitT/TauT family transport system substrate-binding protein